jgi:pyruvate formate lyase activating enzyme
MTVDEVLAEVERDVPFYDESGGGVTFSGGEPLMQPEFLESLLEACGRREIHRTVDTCGHAEAEVLTRIASRADLFLYDLKHMDPAVHARYTGSSNDRILDNLRLLARIGARVRVRYPLIPGINDDEGNLRALGAFLRDLGHVSEIDILPYHDVMIGKYRRLGGGFRLEGVERPSAGLLRNRARILAGFGLRVTIGGELT